MHTSNAKFLTLFEHFFYRFAAIMLTELDHTNTRAKAKWLTDIRFWIILFFILRLYGITNPPLEIAHNWRQTLTNMVARNFLEIDNNIFYPRIDMDGNRTGIIASEFPLYNYLIYLMAKIFGYTHWYGRLISLIFSSFGIFYFYKILKKFFTEELAFYSSMILLSSIWFAFSRKSMPDVFCMSLVIIGIYYGLMYLYEKRIRYLFLFFVISTLAVLSKIPALYLISILAIPLADKNVVFSLKRNIVISGVFILTVVYAWYFYWVPYLLATYGFQLYFPKHFVEGLKELIIYGPDTLEKFYFTALESFIGFAVFLTGVFFIIKKKQKVPFAIIGTATLFFILFIIKTGYVFSVHSYYVIPYVPVMAFAAAFAMIEIKNKKWRVFLVAFIVIEGILNQQDDFRIKDSEKYKLSLETIADKISSKTDLFAINTGKSPQESYFLHRKGWALEQAQTNDLVCMNDLIKKGCKFLILDLHSTTIYPAASKSWKEVFKDDNFVIYSLVKN
jgi:4-amino-4-deoxy-L-arabinose transferase-like glycosyltransferase